MKLRIVLALIVGMTLNSCFSTPDIDSAPPTFAESNGTNLVTVTQTLQLQTKTPSFQTATLQIDTIETIMETSTPTFVPSATPAITLDIKCLEYECLQACMERLPDLVGFLDPGTPLDIEVPQKSNLDGSPMIGVYDLAAYAVKDNSFKRTFTPEVPDRLKKFQDDVFLHKKIWDYIVEIIPESARSVLTGFTIFTDGQGVGSAMETRFSPPYHYLIVDLFDLGDTLSITRLLLHETGHFVTINTSQIKYMIDWHFNTSVDWESFQLGQKECNYFYGSTRCAIPGSYLDLFYKRFWMDRHNYEVYLINHAKYRGESTDPIATQLINDYPDEFLNLYAATDLLEDVAVSFEYFVLGPKPESDRIADQKILFFYEFPELVILREQIIQNICRYAADQ